MGLSFRTSWKMGPLRVNLSGRGVELSAGVRGARVSVGPRGTYVTLSAGGFQYRKRLDGAPPRSPADMPTPAPGPAPLPFPSVAEPGTIQTASVAELQASSPEEALADIQERVHRTNLLLVYCIAGAVLLVVSLGAGIAWLPIVLGVALVAGAVPVYLWDRDRRTARLLYDVDDEAAMERFALGCAAGEALARAARTWHIFFSVETGDQKRNAGATHLIRRTAVGCVPRSLPHIECNLEPWSVPVGPQQLLFLPDRLLVHEGARFAAVRYDQLDAEATETRFIEAGGVPPDGEIVDRTWRYVNRSGGPDRRFKDNRELPVLRYGELCLSSPGGMRIVLQCSTVEATRGAAAALGELVRLCRGDGRATSGPGPRAARPPSGRPQPQPEAAPLPPVRPAPSQDDGPDAARLGTAVAVVLRHLAVADRRFSSDERQVIEDAIREFCAEAPQVGTVLIAQLPEMRADPALLSGALGVLRAAPPHARSRLMELAQRLVAVDGKVTPKERERLGEIHEALGSSN